MPEKGITAPFFSLIASVILHPERYMYNGKILMVLKNRYVIIAGFTLTALIILGLCYPLLVPRTASPLSETICISPSVHPDGLTRYWDTLEAKRGLDAGSAALQHVSLDIYPNDSMERINLQFFALKDGVDRHYSVYYANSKQNCGYFSNDSYPENRSVTEARYPQDPRVFLRDIEQVNTTALGLEGKALSVTTDNTRGDALQYTADTNNCRELYLLQNGSLQRMDRISTLNTTNPAFPRRFDVQNSISTEPGCMSCSSERQVTVITDDRLTAANLVRNTTEPDAGMRRSCPPDNRTFCNAEKFCLFSSEFCYTLSSGCRTYDPATGDFVNSPY